MRTASLLLLPALVGCGDLLFLEGSVNQLCQKLPAQSFRMPQVPGQPPVTGAVTIARQFDFDVTAQLPPELASASLTVGLDRMTLTATRGATDLRFVEAAEVTLLPPAKSTLRPKTVVRSRDVSPAVLRFDGDDLELVPYLESGVLSYTVELTASSMPSPDLAADIDACANVAVRWNYAR